MCPVAAFSFLALHTWKKKNAEKTTGMPWFLIWNISLFECHHSFYVLSKKKGSVYTHVLLKFYIHLPCFKYVWGALASVNRGRRLLKKL